MERHRRGRIARRHQRQAMRDAGHAAEAGGRDAGRVTRRVGVPGARQQHDVERPERAARGRRGRPAVSRHRTAALRPGEQVPVVVGIRKSEDDAEPRPPVEQKRDRDGAAAAPAQVVAGPVVRIHDPERLPRPAGDTPGLLAQKAGPRQLPQQPRPDQVLGFRVGVRLVHGTARSFGAVQVLTQARPGLARGRDRDGERVREIPGHGAAFCSAGRAASNRAAGAAQRCVRRGGRSSERCRSRRASTSLLVRSAPPLSSSCSP